MFDSIYSPFPAQWDDKDEPSGESGTPAIKDPLPPHLQS